MDTKVKELIEKEVVENQKNEIVEVTDEEKAALEKALQEINIKDRNSIILFGSKAQEKLDEISNRMLEGVKNKDTGKTGELLSNMVAAIRGFDIDELNPNDQLSWWQKLLGFTSPVTKFVQKYEDVKSQIETISDELEKHKSKLITDITALEKLYEANLDYFRQLELYIKAGEMKLKELEEKIIPEFEERAKSNDMLAIQELKEIRDFRDDLERRVHDLKLSRQVAMQALPSIRLIQENDKSLINKINSTLVNTIPLWKNQLAQTITIFRSHEAAKAIKSANDLTNDLLEANAEALKEANKDIRKEMERGVFDIESIKKANQTLIETLNESLQIAQQGKEARAKAEIELQKTEKALKDALLATKAQQERLQQSKG
ncbi:MAG: toxic anion resistance protein [Epsilonproteobacteria bacterium]|nr:toxic anion resistance protein [Campylobacterota bacterium]